MNRDDFPIQEWITEQNIILLTALLLIIYLVFVNWNKLRKSWLEWRTRRCLDSIGIKQIRNLVCPDGLDGEYVLDRLIMLPKAILLITFKRYSGNIYCAERISEWTQVVAQKSYKFENPLFELENQLTALRNQLPGTLIRGQLFFDYSTLFPKGHPDSVLHPGNIPIEYLRENCAQPDQAILDAWQVLRDLSTDATCNPQSHLKT